MEAYFRRLSRIPLVLESTFWLALAHLLRKILPIAKLFKLLGIHALPLTTEHRELVLNPQRPSKGLPTRYLDRIAKFLKLDKPCLTTAISARLMFGIRNSKTEIVLGVAHNDSRSLIAHAWAIYDGQIITGRGTEVQFNPISVFSCENPFTKRR